jgi:hypothetical protein
VKVVQAEVSECHEDEALSPADVGDEVSEGLFKVHAG